MKIVQNEKFIHKTSFYQMNFSHDIISDNDKQRFANAIATIWDKYEREYGYEDAFDSSLRQIQDDLCIRFCIEPTDTNLFKYTSCYQAVFAVKTYSEMYYVCDHILNAFSDMQKSISCYMGYRGDGFKPADDLAQNLSKALSICRADATLRKTKNKQYLFYPVSDRDISDILIDSLLYKLTPYPNAQNAYSDALSCWLSDIDAGTKADKFRKALEQFLMDFFNNNKSLENQIKPLGELLKEHGISSEISNMYFSLLNCYTKYNNEHAKHGTDADDAEIEMIFYLTGCFMRFLLNFGDGG